MPVHYREIDWYDKPNYYEIIYDATTAREADFLDTILKRYGQTEGKQVLEPACGSGRLVAELARRSYVVTGFDRNPRMLDFARARVAKLARRTRLFEADLDGFDLPCQFDLAHCLVSTFKYLLGDRPPRNHLELIGKALKPGGIYVLGIDLSEYGSTSRTRERWVGERDGTRVVCNTQTWPPDAKRRVERVRARLVVEERGTTSRFETTWHFRTYNTTEVRQLLRSVPCFEHVATYDFAHDAAQPRELDDRQLDVVLVLRKVSEK